MRSEKAADKSRKVQDCYSIVTVKTREDISAEPAREQEIKEHAVTDLDLRNEENRLSLISSAATAEERQEVSSKNTINEMADAITGGNDIGLWPARTPEKMREYWSKDETGALRYCDEKTFSSHDVAQYKKVRNSSRKCTNHICRQDHNGEVVDRNWLYCLFFTRLCLFFHL